MRGRCVSEQTWSFVDSIRHRHFLIYCRRIDRWTARIAREYWDSDRSVPIVYPQRSSNGSKLANKFEEGNQFSMLQLSMNRADWEHPSITNQPLNLTFYPIHRIILGIFIEIFLMLLYDGLLVFAPMSKILMPNVLNLMSPYCWLIIHQTLSKYKPIVSFDWIRRW